MPLCSEGPCSKGFSPAATPRQGRKTLQRSVLGNCRQPHCWKSNTVSAVQACNEIQLIISNKNTSDLKQYSAADITDTIPVWARLKTGTHKNLLFPIVLEVFAQTSRATQELNVKIIAHFDT